MRAKLSVLRACRRLLRPGGRIGVLTIRVEDGLPEAQRRRTVAAAPPAATGPPTDELLDRAGFVDVDALDVTAEYLETATAWLAARRRHEQALRALGPDQYEDKVARGARAVAEIEAGRLRRSLVTARRPA